MRLFARFALAAMVLISLPACDSGEPEPEPVDINPTFEIASRVVTLSDFSQGLQFFVTPNIGVTLNQIEIRNPLGEGGASAVQNLNILGGQTEALQLEGTGYPRVSGNWTFRFGGILLDDATNNFNVTTTVPVSALVPEGEELPVASE